MTSPDSQVNQDYLVSRASRVKMDNLVEMVSPDNQDIQDRMVTVAHQD
jgi:hypothetical protein